MPTLREEGEPLRAGEAVHVSLQPRPPFDWPGTVRWIAPRAFGGVERIEGDRYVRAFEIDGARGVLAIAPAPADATLTLSVRAQRLDVVPEVQRRVRRLFDLDAPAPTIAAHLARDRTLAPLVRAHRGWRVPGAWQPFEIAVRAILGQQVSVKAATTLAARLVLAHGEPLDAALAQASGLSHAFPTPAVLARADLTPLGIVRARSRTIATLAATVVEDPDLFTRPTDLDGLVTRLTALPGIGPWTAHYIAMRALGEPDAFPHGDLGLMRAYGARIGREVNARELTTIAARWRPWRSYAALLLWRSLATASGG